MGWMSQPKDKDWLNGYKNKTPIYVVYKRLFSSSSLSTIRVASSAYLRLLIFLPAILIPACVSSSPAFLMMYSAYTLNKQGDNILINNYLKRKLVECPNQKTKTGWMDTKTRPLYMLSIETHLETGDTYRLKVKGWKKIFYANRDQKKAGVAILIIR